MAEEKEDSAETLVVKQLPQQPAREISDEEGNSYKAMTTEEAVKELLERVRKIEKAVA